MSSLICEKKRFLKTNKFPIHLAKLNEAIDDRFDPLSFHYGCMVEVEGSDGDTTSIRDQRVRNTRNPQSQSNSYTVLHNNVTGY